jgi:hypothetical protein
MPNLVTVCRLVHVERIYRQHSDLDASLAKGKSAVSIIISVALVSHRHIVTPKNLSLGWRVKDNNSHAKFSYCLSAGSF